MIAVIGAGSWGTAIASVLARNGCPVKLWSHDPQHVKAMMKTRQNERYLPGFSLPDACQPVVEFEEAIAGVQDVFVVVPSNGFADVIQRLAAQKKPYRIAWGTKGLDPESNCLLTDVVKRYFSEDTPQAVLSGPSFAKEVMAELPTAVSLAGNDHVFQQDLLKQLHSKTFRVYLNDDLLGVQLCGALKNVLAIGVGMADGLGLGANSRSAMITRGLAEMGRLCEALGGQRATLMSLAGVGDLVLTCTDNQSRNRRFGLALGRGMDADAAKADIGQAVEGLDNVKQARGLAQQHGIDMPLVEQVYAVIYQDKKPAQALQSLLSREPKQET